MVERYTGPFDGQDTTYEDDITALVFINPEDNQEYTVWGGGYFADDNVTDPDGADYTDLNLVKNNIAKAFGFTTTDKTIKLKKGDTASIDYAVQPDFVETILYGIQYHFASKVI